MQELGPQTASKQASSDRAAMERQFKGTDTTRPDKEETDGTPNLKHQATILAMIVPSVVAVVMLVGTERKEKTMNKRKMMPCLLMKFSI